MLWCGWLREFESRTINCDGNETFSVAVGIIKSDGKKSESQGGKGRLWTTAKKMRSFYIEPTTKSLHRVKVYSVKYPWYTKSCLIQRVSTDDYLGIHMIT
jgi:hypothetical protein